MDAKDIVSVLVIPLIVLGVLAFGPQITGLAIFESSNVIGQYSINPSFIFEKGYNPEEYKNLRLRLRTAIEECKKNNDIESCIESKTSDLQCSEDNSILFALNDIKDKLNECLEVEGVCTFDIEPSEQEIALKISSEGRRARISSSGFSDSLDIDGLSYAGYENRATGNPLDEIEITIGPLGAAFRSGDIELSSKAVYVSNGEMRFIDILEENSFLDEQANSIISVPMKRGMKFCHESSGILYKFAIVFPSPPLKTLESLKAFDAAAKEDFVILQWDGAKGAKSYNIYYSEKDFEDMKISDIKNDANIKKISFNSKDAIELQSSYEKEKLYKKDNFFSMMLPAPDGKPVYYAVTAIGNDGNEIDNDKSIEGNNLVLTSGRNYVSFTSIDDVAPSRISDLSMVIRQSPTLEFSKPLKNIDGTDAVDIANFNVYYKEGVYDFIDSSFKVKSFTAASSGCTGVAVNCAIPLDLNPGTYSIGVVALDEKNNADMTVQVRQFTIN